MKKNDASLRNFFHVLDHAIEVQITTFSVIVTVLANFQARVFKDGNVVTPSWVRNIDMLVTKRRKELSHDAESAGSRQSLDTSHSVLGERN